MAWSQAPARALGRFEAGRPPKTLDEMYACATSESERASITDLLFGSVTDVLDRYLPDRESTARSAGCSLSWPSTPPTAAPRPRGSAAALVFGLAVPDENTTLMKKLRGGIGALTTHLREQFTAAGGELQLRTEVTEIRVVSGRVTGVTAADGSTANAPVVVSCLAPDLTLTQLVTPSAVASDVRERFSRTDHRGSDVQMHFALDGAPEFAAPYELLNDPSMQAARFCRDEGVTQR